MKIILTVLSILAIGLSAQAKELKDPQALFTFLAKVFPTEVISSGFSHVIDLSEVTCMFQNGRTDKGVPMVKKICVAENSRGQFLYGTEKDEELNNLMLAMINSGDFKIDQKTVPNATVLEAINLSCARIECKAGAPKVCEGLPVKFTCTLN